MRLYHYCCSCSATRITARGFLRPMSAQVFGVGLIWLTDQAVPDREGLGLTSNTLKCDRLEHQYVVDVEPTQVERWLTSPIRARLSLDMSFHEFEDGRHPETWWIAQAPVFAIRNRRYTPPEADDAVGQRRKQPYLSTRDTDSSSFFSGVSEERERDRVQRVMGKR